jgi:hypothetical protein
MKVVTDIPQAQEQQQQQSEVDANTDRKVAAVQVSSADKFVGAQLSYHAIGGTPQQLVSDRL